MSLDNACTVACSTESYTRREETRHCLPTSRALYTPETLSRCVTARRSKSSMWPQSSGLHVKSGRSLASATAAVIASYDLAPRNVAKHRRSRLSAPQIGKIPDSLRADLSYSAGIRRPEGGNPEVPVRGRQQLQVQKNLGPSDPAGIRSSLILLPISGGDIGVLGPGCGESGVPPQQKLRAAGDCFICKSSSLRG